MNNLRLSIKKYRSYNTSFKCVFEIVITNESPVLFYNL